MQKKNNNIWLWSVFKLNGLVRSIYRFRIKYSNDHRPSSYPYISGDSFVKIADHCFDGVGKFDILNIKFGDTVFVQTDKLRVFFKEVHPKILTRYILITHNSDLPVGINISRYLDEKIIKWYGQNVLVDNSKIIPIPIGLENIYYYNNGIIKYFNNITKKCINKKNQILFGFSTNTNMSERTNAFEIAKKCDVCKEIGYKLNSWYYLNLLNNYKFIISPPGNGLDCHRTWEAIYLKVIPIVKRSVATEYFYSIGMPLLIVDSWEEILKFDRSGLEKKYDNLKDRFDCGALYMDYWANIIRKI